jgi:hypothetical protein
VRRGPDVGHPLPAPSYLEVALIRLHSAGL